MRKLIKYIALVIMGVANISIAAADDAESVYTLSGSNKYHGDLFGPYVGFIAGYDATYYHQERFQRPPLEDSARFMTIGMFTGYNMVSVSGLMTGVDIDAADRKMTYRQTSSPLTTYIRTLESSMRLRVGFAKPSFMIYVAAGLHLYISSRYYSGKRKWGAVPNPQVAIGAELFPLAAMPFFVRVEYRKDFVVSELVSTRAVLQPTDIYQSGIRLSVGYLF